MLPHIFTLSAHIAVHGVHTHSCLNVRNTCWYLGSYTKHLLTHLTGTPGSQVTQHSHAHSVHVLKPLSTQDPEVALEISADTEIYRLVPSGTQTLHRKFWCVVVFPILLVRGFRSPPPPHPHPAQVAGGKLSVGELSSLCRKCQQVFDLAGEWLQRSH